MNVELDDERDELLHLWLRLRDALAPLGVAVGPQVLELWRDSWARRTGLFSGSGEFNSYVVRRLAAFTAELEANTADPSTGEQRGDAAERFDNDPGSRQA